MNIRNFWELVAFNVRFGLKAEIRNYALSYLWWVAEPALHLLVLFFMLRKFFGGGDEKFIPFLFCGIVPWIWLSKSVAQGAGSISEGRHIIRDTKINKFLFPTVSVLKAFAKEVPVFLLLLLVLVFTGIKPGPSWLQLPMVIVLQFAFIAGTVYCVSIITPFLPDLSYIITTGLQLTMFASGTFYDYRAMSPEFQKFFLMNPVALLINMYRDVLMYGKYIQLSAFIYVGSFALAMGIINLVLYKNLHSRLPRVLYR